MPASEKCPFHEGVDSDVHTLETRVGELTTKVAVNEEARTRMGTQIGELFAKLGQLEVSFENVKARTAFMWGILGSLIGGLLTSIAVSIVVDILAHRK